MRTILSAVLGLIVMAGVAPLASGPARADCYDVYGCTDTDRFRLQDLLDGPNCQFLWTMRNAIYKERGYCFRTQRGIRAFGNAGCLYDDVEAVPLSAIERANAVTILRAERMKGCPR